MRRVIRVATTFAVVCAVVVFLEVRTNRSPVLEVAEDAQRLSAVDGRAVLRATLGPGADRSSFRATLNGEDVSSRFRFAGEHASAHVEDLRDGANRLVVSVRDVDRRLHRADLELDAPAAIRGSDRTAELRDAGRNIMAARQARRRSPTGPARLLDLTQRAVAAMERLDRADGAGRAAEGEAALIADLAGDAQQAVAELADHYRGSRRLVASLGLDGKLERLDTVEARALASAAEIAETLHAAASGDAAARRRAMETLERITRAPEPPVARPGNNQEPPPIPGGLTPLDFYQRAVAGEALAGHDPAQLLEEPVRELPSPRLARLSIDTPAAHAQASDPDLEPGTGVRFDLADPDDPIVQQAAALGHDPVLLYEFVRNEIEFEIYAGISRGARSTLLTRRGNSADQAALLIALLRVSGYKARFVFGDVLIDTDRVVSWLNVRSREAAHRIAGKQQFAPSFHTDGGEEVMYFQDTYWVKALVPYGPDRGRSTDAALRWVFLDPSVKPHDTRPGIDLPLSPFDFGTGSGGYLGSVKLRTPIELWADEVRTALRASHPDQTLADMGVRGPIVRSELGMLPATLPYRPVQFHAEFADLGDLPAVPFDPPGDFQPHDLIARRYIVDLRGTDGTTILLRHEVRAADFAHRRVTIGWQGATPADQALIDGACQGDVSLCPDPGLVDVVPVVRHDGVDVQVGTSPLTLGDTARMFIANVDSAQFAVCIASSNNDPDVFLYTDPCYYHEFSGLVAGARFALVFDVGQASQALIDERATGLLTAYESLGLEHAGETGFPLAESEWESLVGELLYIGSLRYAQRLAEQSQLLEDVAKYWNHPQGRGQAHSLVGVGFLSGTPVSIVPAGLLIDVFYVTGVMGIDMIEDPAEKSHAFQLLSYTSSTLEHQLWEELTQFESVSTMKGLQWVQDNPGFGATVVTLDDPGDSIPPLLPAGVKARIQAELDAGRTVHVPDRELTIELWSGVVYVAEKLDLPLSSAFLIITTGFASNGGIAIGSSPFFYDPPIYNGIGASFDLVRILDPINVASGNVDYSRTDVQLSTRGSEPVRLARTYNSQLAEVGPFGFGWTHSYHWYVEAVDDDADGTPGEPEDADGQTSGLSVVDGRGSVRRFAITSGTPASGTFVSEPGHHLHLENAGASLELREPDGTRRTFAGFGASPSVGERRSLLALADPAGNLTSLVYTGALLTQVVDPLGRTLTLQYDGADHVDRIDDWSGRSWTYFYVGDDLVEVRDPLDGSLDRATERYEYYAQQFSPENDHNLKRHEDGNGNGVTFYYYQNDKAYKQVDDEGGETRLSYDVFRLETVEIDPAGHRQLYQYDANGNLQRLVRKNGAIEDYVYDPVARNLLATSDAFGHSTQYAYDAFGNVKSTTSPGGATTSFVYWYEENPGELANSPRHNKVVERTDPLGSVFRFDYDSRGLLTLETVTMNVSGAPTVVELRRFEYDAFGNLTKRIENIDPATPLVDPATDRVTEFVYDATGLRLVETRGALGGITRNIHDVDLGEPDRGLVRRVERERHAVYPDGTEQRTTTTSETTYDVLGRSTGTIDGFGTTRAPVYDAGGRVIARLTVGQDAADETRLRSTSTTWDRNDRRISVTDALGGITRFEYDALGNVVKQIDPNGHATRFVHDANGDVTSRTDPTGATVHFVRDAKGRVLRAIDPLGNATFRSYDVEDRLLSETDADGNRIDYAYDANGNRIGVTSPRGTAGAIPLNADGYTQTHEYDELGRLVLVRDAIGGETRFELDLLGNPTRIRDAEGHETIQAFDREGRMVSQTNPLLLSETRSYDTLGNLIAVQDPKGQSAQLYYDLENRELSAVYSDGSEIAFTFDGFGNAVLERAPAVSYVNRYDALDRPVSRIDTRFDSAQRFTWDAAGRLSSHTDLEGGVTQYRWDEAGRIVGISTPDGTQVERHYDAASRLVAQHWGSGATTLRVHTPAGQLDRIEHRSALGALLVSRDYAYDEDGNRTGATFENGGSEAYGYDALGRLTSVLYADVSQQTFAYDAVGNRTYENDRGAERWFQHDDANRIETISGDPAGSNVLWAFVYDENGNPLSRIRPDLSEWISYDWDVRDRLVQAQDLANGGLWTFAYDSRNRRVGQTAPEKTRSYVWARDDRVAEYESGSPVARFTYGTRLDDAVQVDRGGSAAHLHADGLGTVVSVSSPSGVELASYAYDAFGALRSSAGSFENDLGFTGRERDSTGLLYYRARYYDPGLGRFLNPDPIRFDGGINFYAYANNNPVTLTDPTGEIIPLVVGVFIGTTTSVLTELIVNPDADAGDLVRAGLVGAGLGVFGGGLGSIATNTLLKQAGVTSANLAGAVARESGRQIVGATITGSTIAGGTTAAIANTTGQLLGDQPFDHAQLGAFTAAGAFSGFIGGASAALPFNAAAAPGAPLITQSQVTAGAVLGEVSAGLVDFGIGTGLNGLFRDTPAPTPPAPAPPPITACVKGRC